MVVSGELASLAPRHSCGGVVGRGPAGRACLCHPEDTGAAPVCWSASRRKSVWRRHIQGKIRVPSNLEQVRIPAPGPGAVDPGRARVYVRRQPLPAGHRPLVATVGRSSPIEHTMCHGPRARHQAHPTFKSLVCSVPRGTAGSRRYRACCILSMPVCGRLSCHDDSNNHQNGTTTLESTTISQNYVWGLGANRRPIIPVADAS